MSGQLYTLAMFLTALLELSNWSYSLKTMYILSLEGFTIACSRSMRNCIDSWASVWGGHSSQRQQVQSCISWGLQDLVQWGGKMPFLDVVQQRPTLQTLHRENWPLPCKGHHLRGVFTYRLVPMVWTKLTYSSISAPSKPETNPREAEADPRTGKCLPASSGEPPFPRIMLIGETGVGKSTLGKR